MLRYLYAYDAAGNRTSKKTDYDDDDGSFAATAIFANNGYNQLTAVSGSPGRGNRVNVTGTIPTAWTLADGDVKVTPNGGAAVDAEVRGRFFIARNVPLNSSPNNTIVASTTATTLADHDAVGSDTVTNVALDTSLDVAHTYDANGNLISKSEEGGAVLWTYTYSVEDWLTKVEGPNGFSEEYFYDPIGRKYKTQTTQAGQTTTGYLIYDGGSILLDLDENRHLAREHVWGLGGLFYTRQADGSVGYYHYDGARNVVSITSDAREEIAAYEYDAWGNLLGACGDFANEFRFSTKQASLGTGLTDFGFRWYDPTTGRWTQRDPIGVAGGVNVYSYVGGNPANFGDSSGLERSPFGLDFTTGSIPSRAAGSMNLETNDVADGIAVVNSFINGGTEAVLDDPALELVGGFCQVVIGGTASWCGLPELGVPVMGYGMSNMADAISRISGGGPYNPARDLTAGLFELFFGMSPENAQVAAGITEGILTFGAGRYTNSSLARPWGRAGSSRNAGGRVGSIPESAHGKSWRTQRRHYWRQDTRGFSSSNANRILVGDKSPIGMDGYPMVLHHRSKIDKYAVKEMTRTNHIKWHQQHGWHR